MLATRCPHCQTRFRITTQQLQLRNGTVRCGACRALFNASEYLADQDHQPELVSAPAIAQAEQDESAGPMTLMDFSAWQSAPSVKGESTMQDELDALSKAISDLQSKPWREQEVEPARDWDEDEPGFVQQARQKQRMARVWKFVLIIGLPLLLMALAAQLVFHFRDEIAVRVPETAPLLRKVCARLGCTITLPSQIEALTLQASELQAVPDQANQFVMVALVRNQSNTPQAWPNFDLLLKDEAGQPLVRKSFLPLDYLPLAADQKRGIAAHAEREIRIHFELSGTPAAGFELTLFYH
jgi:predicted Zn finger-like uncharacterized protein